MESQENTENVCMRFLFCKEEKHAGIKEFFRNLFHIPLKITRVVEISTIAGYQEYEGLDLVSLSMTKEEATAFFKEDIYLRVFAGDHNLVGGRGYTLDIPREAITIIN